VKTWTEAEIKALLIKSQTRPGKGRLKLTDFQVNCANSPQGCNSTIYIFEDGKVELDQGWIITDDGKIYCQTCSECRVCDKKNTPQILHAPADKYSSVYSHRSAGGLCRKCYKTIRWARQQLKKHEVFYPGNNKKLDDLKSLSSKGHKLYGYAKLVHDKDPYRVFEIGYFWIDRGGQREDLVRFTQFGTTCEMRRGRNVQVFKKRRTQLLNEEDRYDEKKNPTKNSRYMSPYYEDNLTRTIDYLRGIGYKVVEMKDIRNGRACHIDSDWRASKPGQKLAEQKEEIDEKLGQKHQDKLEAIERSYWRTVPTSWMTEALK
jgi:hypothetical protein